jgi:hypothetical protein
MYHDDPLVRLKPISLKKKSYTEIWDVLAVCFVSGVSETCS